MISKEWKYTLLTLIVFLCVPLNSHKVTAQSTQNEEIEVYLSFTYRGAVNSVIISYFKDDEFYLPFKELFQILGIDNSVDLSDGKILLSGRFLKNQTPYTINLVSNQSSFGDENFPISKDDYLVKELDYYIKASFFKDFFGLDFQVDFNNLAIKLETNFEIPAVQRLIRQQKREQVENNQRTLNLNYPVKYNRDRKVFGAGFLDYNLSVINTDEANLFLINTAVGAEVLGGDVQGSLSSSYSKDVFNLNTNNLRWRYAFTNNSAITSIFAGQVSSDGFLGNPFTGIKITNQPIEPRRLYDEFVVQGNTLSRSEVELYLNNNLIDFQEADAAGNYRFITPLTYGTSSYDLRIFGPTGQVLEKSKRIQVPFSFLPPGEINYNLNVGKLENPILGTQDRGFIAQGNTKIGVTNWLTANAGLEYFENYNDNAPTFNGGFSARILNKYLLTTEVLPNVLARARGSAIFGNSSSIGLSFTDYYEDGGIYNTSSVTQEIQGSIFYPFRVGETPLNVRFFASRLERLTSPFTRYRVDLNTRVSRFNIRAGLSNSSVGNNFFALESNAELNFSTTYTFPRYENTPKVFHSLFMRGEISFLPTDNELKEISIFASRSIFDQGNIQLSYSKNFRFQYNAVSLGLVIDFNKTRANSRFNSIRGSNTLTNTIRGSVGYDANNSNFLLTSRNQVGRSASAVRLFVDYDGDEKFSEGDELIRDNAIRLDRTGTTQYKDGITYITQMQPYFKYNMEINKGAIKNPLLVPRQDKFGVISDPNFFKPIDIPFYSSGIIEGVVNRRYNNEIENGIGGIRLYLENVNENTVQELRSFSDGSFYSYEIKPGKYELSIDPAQLEILESKSLPSKIDIEIEALADGDFVEGLSFLIAPKDFDPDKKEEIPAETIIADISTSPEIIEFKADLDKKITETLRLIVLAQTAFYNRDIDNALNLVNQSLELFETAQGYALKGSLNYLNGNKAEAQKNWEAATQFNPDIFIPDIEILDRIIRTQLGD